MRSRTALVPALAAAALAATPARADAPWSPTVTVPESERVATAVVFTPTGHGAVATEAPVVQAPGFPDTVLTAVEPDGSVGHQQRLQLASPRLAAYRDGGIVIAGTRPGTTDEEVRDAPVLLGLGAPATGIPELQAVPGTAGQQLLALAGSGGDTIAFVTGDVSGSRQERIVWLRRGGSLRRVLTIRVGERARGAAVAIGSHGDVLVAWEDDFRLFARHLAPDGHAGPVYRLAGDVYSSIQVAYDDSGRQEVAWLDQFVDESKATTGATVSYASAAKGHGFTRPVVVGRADVTGQGRYVAPPGVRLVESGTDSSVLAFTIFDGKHFRVAVANVAGGRVQKPETVSPRGEDAVLGDVGYARAGGALVVWRTGTAGADRAGRQQVFASRRAAGQDDFDGPERVSDSVDTRIPISPVGAVDPESGAAVALYNTEIAPRVAVSARPAR